MATLNSVLSRRADAWATESLVTGPMQTTTWQLDSLRLIRTPTLRGIAWPGMPIPHQTYFWAPGCGQQVIVPAQELICLLLTGNEKLRPLLFTPTAPESFLESDPLHRVKLVPALKRRGTSHGMSLLRWITSYPSARRAWASVYAHALDGRLGLHLPNARMEVRFRGVTHGPHVLTVDCALAALEPTEAPFVPDSHGPAPWTFKTRAEERFRRVPLLHRADGSLQLSDEEWAEINDILGEDLVSAVENTRVALNALVYAHASGTSWSHVPVTPTVLASAMRLWALIGKRRLRKQVLRVLQARAHQRWGTLE